MQLLRKILFPFSLIYALVVYLRNFLFDVGIFKSKSFSTPIVCIGNLSVGGTGKTPMIEFLIDVLQNDKKIAVLSRGYGRNSDGFLLADKDVTVENLGDEPYQIHQKFPNVTVTVDADRRNGISILEKEIKPNVILLDDAFQHRKVKAKFNILLTAYGNLYASDWYLPTGNLRDAKNQSKRADIIVVTKCLVTISDAEQNKIIQKLKPKTNQKVLFAYLSYTNTLVGENSTLSLDALKNKSIVLVTGIANPDPLCQYLSTKDIAFEHLKYGDHHFFTEKQLALFNTKEIVLTTEKDYVRLKGKVKNLYFIGIKHQFVKDGKEALENALKSIV